MAETPPIELPEDVSLEEPVKWKPVRDLADAISKLYSDKKMFEFESLEPGSMKFGISTDEKSTRWSDEYASKCTNDSSEEKGCVYLTADVTAPFRLDKLGTDEKTKLEPRVIAFEFAYNPDTYEEYLSQKLPVLVTQYLIYYEAIDNDKAAQENVALCTDALEKDLCSNPAPNEFMVIGNLVESRRDKIRKFWDKGKTYSQASEVAAELYMIVEDSNTAGCNIISRIAWAGMNGNGNGNSPMTGAGRPAPWLDGNVCGGVGRFVEAGQDPWMEGLNPRAITLTGVNWDREPKSAPSRNGFKPETQGASGYTPPPIGCCAEFLWPSIGLEGGGGENNFYNPIELSNLITWADWREEYQHPLTPEELAKAEQATRNISTEDIPERHFPCYLAKDCSGDKADTYNHITSIIQLNDRYQRWIKLSQDLYVRLAPMEFKVDDVRKAYLTVPLTIAKVLRPKAYQTAIRKRWYDMLYYSLRNIAGYKIKTTDTTTNSTVEKVIGVTWDASTLDIDTYLNPCKKQTSSQQPTEKCSCDSCKYERWKIFDLGGEGWKKDSEYKIEPFVGTIQDFEAYNGSCTYNAAQMWQWEASRHTAFAETLAADQNYNFFPELYFEKLICYNNAETFGESPGGFVLSEKEDSLCECHMCDESIILPWHGGGNNSSCDTSFTTHAFTFNKLKQLTKFIIEYKLPENAPRDIGKLEIGEAHSYASAKNSLTFTGGTRKYATAKDSSGASNCIKEENAVYKLPLIPAYYQTLSADEKSQVSVSSSIEVKTSKEDKSYGYNAYIWKAFDPGGYAEYHTSDLTIKFVHKTPAPVCASPTVVNVNAAGIKKEGGDQMTGDSSVESDDPLYLHDNTAYIMDEGYCKTVHMYNCCATNLRPGKMKDPAVLEHNWKEDTWEELIQWCSTDPVQDGSLCPPHSAQNYIDPVSAGAIALWHRDNEQRSIGTIDIYIAPVADGDASRQNKIKYLGSCTFKLTTSGTSVPESCYAQPPGDCATPPTDASFEITSQVVVDNTITENARASKPIEVTVVKSPSPQDNEMEASITISSELLKDTGYEIANDQRQRYIILAVRASHAHLNSWLASKGTCDLKGADKKLKEWAMHYAGACRHAEFDTSYEFSRNTDQ